MVKIKSEIQQEQIDKDPFLQLGEGIHGYRSILIEFIKLFSVISLLSIPIMYIYNEGGAYD
jgi:hypothetical protein